MENGMTPEKDGDRERGNSEGNQYPRVVREKLSRDALFRILGPRMFEALEDVEPAPRPRPFADDAADEASAGTLRLLLEDTIWPKPPRHHKPTPDAFQAWTDVYLGWLSTSFHLWMRMAEAWTGVFSPLAAVKPPGEQRPGSEAGSDAASPSLALLTRLLEAWKEDPTRVPAEFTKLFETVDEGQAWVRRAKIKP